MQAIARGTRVPFWYWATVGLGLAWNTYGVYQFIGTFSATPEKLMSAGLTAAQAQLYLSLPAWMTVVFAIGVFGALAGCILLALQKKLAVPVLLASFVGYALLFAGDWAYGVFAAIPTQLMILTTVISISAVLLGFARSVDQRGMLS
jgi:hypothetical protein